MSKADSATKAFLSNPEVFAEVFNIGLFGGKRYIDPHSIRIPSVKWIQQKLR